MLTWFPTPYPDESFYSVLCRYYVSAGTRSHKGVCDQLFDGRSNINISSIYPFPSIHIILSKLPKKIFNAKNIILHHTAFLYYTRIYSAEVRDGLINEIIHGVGKSSPFSWNKISKKDSTLRYCPYCVEEDMKAFGEPYYHVEHQIPLSSVCVRHNCRLKQIKVKNLKPPLNKEFASIELLDSDAIINDAVSNSRYSKFFPLGVMDLDKDADTDISISEKQISQAVYQYWKLPYSISPHIGTNNLYQALINGGFKKLDSTTGILVDNKKLYDSLCEYHGKNIIDKVFGHSLTLMMANRIRYWEQIMPDRYILIQTMLGMPAKTVFSQEPIADKMRLKIEHLARSNQFYTITQVKKELGINDRELKIYLRSYNIQPFWRTKTQLRKKAPLKKTIVCYFSENEIEQIVQCSQKLGFTQKGTFIKECVRYVIENLNQNDSNFISELTH